MNLKDLAIKYGSDKAEHGYCEFYEHALPKNPLKILEIGVKEGASIRMWLDYFPEATIYGLDLFVENDISSTYDKVVNNDTSLMDRCHFVQGNQVDHLVLEQLRKHDFDIIIDDGSHNSRDQMITFFGLFNGKHYFIEDIHCCREEFYRQGLPYNYTADQIFPRGDGIYNVTYDKNIVCVTGL